MGKRSVIHWCERPKDAQGREIDSIRHSALRGKAPWGDKGYWYLCKWDSDLEFYGIPQVEFLKWFPFADDFIFLEEDREQEREEKKKKKKEAEESLEVDIDLVKLDFLDGKILDEKTLNWGVGQLMKKYPGEFNPQVVKKALRQKFLNEQ